MHAIARIYDKPRRIGTTGSTRRLLIILTVEKPLNILVVNGSVKIVVHMLITTLSVRKENFLPDKSHFFIKLTP